MVLINNLCRCRADQALYYTLPANVQLIIEVDQRQPPHTATQVHEVISAMLRATGAPFVVQVSNLTFLPSWMNESLPISLNNSSHCIS